MKNIAAKFLDRWSRRNLCPVWAVLLLATPAARGQITFTIDAYTPTQLKITLNPSTLTGTAPEFSKNVLTLVNGDHIYALGWLTNSSLTGTPTAPSSLGGVAFTGGYVALGGGTEGHRLKITGASDFISGASISAPYQLTFDAPNDGSPFGTFDLSVNNFALYWGDPIGDSSVVLQTYGSTSAIPEPSTYAVICGALVLGCAGIVRRRQRVARPGIPSA